MARYLFLHFSLGNPAAPASRKTRSPLNLPTDMESNAMGKTTNTENQWMLRQQLARGNWCFLPFSAFWWEVSINKQKLFFLQTFSGVVDEKLMNMESLKEILQGGVQHEVGRPLQAKRGPRSRQIGSLLLWLHGIPLCHGDYVWPYETRW